MTADRDLLVSLAVRTLGIPENLAWAAIRDVPEPQPMENTMQTYPDISDADASFVRDLSALATTARYEFADSDVVDALRICIHEISGNLRETRPMTNGMSSFASSVMRLVILARWRFPDSVVAKMIEDVALEISGPYEGLQPTAPAQAAVVGQSYTVGQFGVSRF